MKIENYPDVWMYHYIRPQEDKLFPYLNKISLENFKKHLDYIQDNYKVLSPEEFIYNLKRGYFLSECSLLTFDDGLADHYNWVLPELEKRGIKAIFFVSTLPLLEKRFTNIHKIHCLYGKKGYPWFMEEFLKTIINRVSCIKKDVFYHFEATNAYPYDTREIAGFKYAINYLIPYEDVLSVVDMLFAYAFNEKEMLENFYMSIEQLKQMKAKGMTIGLHGHSHRAFSSLSDDELRREMESCTRFIRDHIHVTNFFLSFPYGDSTSVESRNIEIISEFNVQCAFFADDTGNTDNYQLSRKDCVELEKLLSN